MEGRLKGDNKSGGELREGSAVKWKRARNENAS